ncbi:MAG TPA: PQQ-binding-like beta-propeller repeat protein, partial [Ktedonosporobacter sp.]|nr:PQQ-binding-like beta-propeller repeat protein [Ktedonosporobacter sp.]
MIDSYISGLRRGHHLPIHLRFIARLGVSLLLLALAACSLPGASTTTPPAVLTPLAISPTAAATPKGNTATTTAATQSTDWTMYHRDLTHTGSITNMPDPQKLTLTWNTQLDGAVYTEPLAVGEHVLVATESNTLYALDRHTGQIQWHTTIASPVPRSALPCGNIDPLGITGTPVYDPATSLL